MAHELSGSVVRHATAAATRSFDGRVGTPQGQARTVGAAATGAPAISWPLRTVLAGVSLLLADAIALQILLVGSILVVNMWTEANPIALWQDEHLGLGLCAFILPIAYLVAGLRPGYGMCPIERLRRNVLAGCFALLLVAVWDVLGLIAFDGAPVPLPLPLYLAMLLAIPAVPLVEMAACAFADRLGIWGVPVVIVGATKFAEEIVHALGRDRSTGFKPVFVLDDRVDRRDGDSFSLPVHGSIHEASALGRHVQKAIVALPNASQQRLSEIVDRLPTVQVLVVADRLVPQCQSVAATDLGGTIAISYRRDLLIPRNLHVKRIIDLALGSCAAILALPIICAAVIAIKVKDPGPAFYRQERIGLNGRPFLMLKLRTMVLGAEAALEHYLSENEAARREWETHMKLRHDPRIIPVVGHLLRMTSIDELPQLWHVLRGEMSLVGPRPFPPYHLRKFSTTFQSLRHGVPPGLTGFWQVTDRSDGDLSVQEAQDRYYIRNWSIWMDLYILARTFRAVAMGDGAR